MVTNNSNIALSEENATPLICTLSCRELQQRKETVFAELNKKRISKTELTDGYAFEFVMDEETEKQINSFIESEKECCSFFQFNLEKENDKRVLKLEIVGPYNVKSFIDANINI